MDKNIPSVESKLASFQKCWTKKKRNRPCTKGKQTFAQTYRKRARMELVCDMLFFSFIIAILKLHIFHNSCSAVNTESTAAASL